MPIRLASINHPAQADEMFQKAVEQDPNLPAPHIGLGYVAYVRHDNAAALAEFNRAIGLDQRDFRPYHFRALLLLRAAGYTKDSTPQIIANLQKVIALAPDFAPAYGFISVAYRQQDSTKSKSFDAAVRASTLEPANYHFMVDIGDALLAVNHDQDAIQFLDRMQKSARTPGDRELVEAFARRLRAHQNPAANKDKNPDSSAKPADADPSEQVSSVMGADAQSVAKPPAADTQEGVIQEVACAASSISNMRFAILGKTLSLAAADSSKIALRAAGKDSTLSAVPCDQWKGRKARISFVPSPDEKAPGEILSIDLL